MRKCDLSANLLVVVSRALISSELTAQMIRYVSFVFDVSGHQYHVACQQRSGVVRLFGIPWCKMPKAALKKLGKTNTIEQFDCL